MFDEVVKTEPKQADALGEGGGAGAEQRQPGDR